MQDTIEFEDFYQTLAKQLDAVTPNPSDFVMYCTKCEWLGQTNAVHAKSSTCPKCLAYGVRIWKHTPVAAKRVG